MIKILLVEDDPDILDLTTYILRREHFIVIEASDGQAALADRQRSTAGRNLDAG